MPTLTMSTAMMMVMVVVMMLPLAPVMTESGVVFTSMLKLQQLARMEGELLQWLDDYEKHGEIPAHLKQFAESRREVRRQHDHVELHPNSGYLLIYAFVDYWTRITEAVPSLKELGDNAQVVLPDEDDLIGALKAILRLQSTYNLSTSAVYSGNYSGYLGPALSHRDALELGTEAFGDNDFGRTTSWLQLARVEIERNRQEMERLSEESERSKEESGRPREQSEQPKQESRRPKDKPGQPKHESERPKKESGRPKDEPGRPKEESGRPEDEPGRPKEETERPKFETEGSEKDVERSKEGTERSKRDMAMSAESSTPSSEDRDPEDQAEEEGDLKEDVLCLLGRTYLKLGDREMAEELLKEASELPIASTGNKTSRDREALEKELNPPPPAEKEEGEEEEEEEEGKRKNKEVKVPVPNAPEPESVSQTMRDLCRRHRSTTTLGNLKPFHVCRYKPAFQVPFLLYKEEILSLSPYVSLFRDFVSDTEIEALKGIDTTKMEPCYPQICPRGVDNTKTGQYHRLNDSRSEMAARLSRRLGHMIWLEANDRNLSAAEGWQVMNYGLAGHDSGHVDYVRHSKTFNRNLPRSYQNRLASFLLHLSDIDMGGQTVFEKLNISVAPVKGLGVFWYNQRPDGEFERLTEHAACPVLKGDKWVAHKWILEKGNMHRRPCGPDPSCSQLDLEAIMYDRRGLPPSFARLPE